MYDPFPQLITRLASWWVWKTAVLIPPSVKGARYFFPARNYLRIYQIREMEKGALHRRSSRMSRSFRWLLKSRPDKVPNGMSQGEAYQQLPDYPPRNAAHLFQVKMQYLDASWGSGLFYLAQFTQGPGNAPNNEELTYLFQGLSKDGQFFVSADLRVTHPKLDPRY